MRMGNIINNAVSEREKKKRKTVDEREKERRRERHFEINKDKKVI
jgi:hypothetical protein